MTMICVPIWDSTVKVNDLQAYRNIDLTLEHIRIIDSFLSEIYFILQNGFSSVEAEEAVAIL